ncbi:hypothetical protein [Sediminicurvatus halobius]|uniref:hypothetical protein n=1 Tax=Sediminicurvatus halobius TaxID=2182432 RepID=UPI0011B1EB74|nr:hypothetical protein [Spiribacter halobius]UEX77713.1 hypothetical protein LMH63_17550 [Spiribacter halobius]
MPHTTDRLMAFPQDDRKWWIRWVEPFKTPRAGTASPSLKVWLAPVLDDGTALDLRATLTNTDDDRDVEVLAGVAPRLALGAVFENGVEQGGLPLETRTLSFKRDTSRIYVDYGLSTLEPAPPNWNSTAPYRVLNRYEYPVSNAPNGQCVVLTDPRNTLIIPCYEVFRTLCAPTAEFARALLSGPWQEQVAQIVNPDRTGIIDGNRWQVVLRMRVENEFLTLAANLALGARGHSVASSIYGNAVTSRAFGNRLPFNSSWYRFTVRGFKSPNDPEKFIALQIVRFGCEYPFSKLMFERDNSNEPGADQRTTDDPAPHESRRPQGVPDDTRPFPVSSDEDPREDSDALHVVAQGCVLEDEPEKERLQKEESLIYTARRRSHDEEVLSRSSSGSPFHGRSDAAKAEYQAEGAPDLPERLGLVIDLMDRLKAAGHILDWRATAPESGNTLRGKFPAWIMPLGPGKSARGQAITPWCYLNSWTGQRRAALVLELSMRWGNVYWIEIEPRVSEKGFQAILACLGGDYRRGVQELLRVAVRNEGVWPPSISPEMANAGVLGIERFKHHREATTAGQSMHHNAPLAITHAINVLRRLNAQAGRNRDRRSR